MNNKLLNGLTCLMAGLLVVGCHSTPYTSTADHTNDRLDDVEAECKANNTDNNEDCDVHTLAEKVGLRCENRAVTGSRIGVRTCTTAEQRKQATEQSKALANDFQRQPFRHKTAETFMHDTNGS